VASADHKKRFCAGRPSPFSESPKASSESQIADDSAPLKKKQERLALLERETLKQKVADTEALPETQPKKKGAGPFRSEENSTKKNDREQPNEPQKKRHANADTPPEESHA
jgi:hypothetical protein